MSIIWYQRENWLEVRKPTVRCFIEEKEQYPVHVGRSYHCFRLPSSIRRISIQGREWRLDPSLQISIKGNCVLSSEKGEYLIRNYDDLERVWKPRIYSSKEEIDLLSLQHPQAWRYIQIVHRINNRIGPVCIHWLPPKKRPVISIEGMYLSKGHTLSIQHSMPRVLCMISCVQKSLIGVEENHHLMIHNIPSQRAFPLSTYGDRFEIRAPDGWLLAFEGEEMEVLHLQTYPSHFRHCWKKVAIDHASKRVEKKQFAMLFPRLCSEWGWFRREPVGIEWNRFSPDVVYGLCHE